MIRKSFLLLTILLVFLATALLAQFGGRPGEAVVYLFTTKGRNDFQVVPFNTTNDPQAAAKFEVINSKNVPAIPLGKGFPDDYKRRFLHVEPDDLFLKLIEGEGDPGPHRLQLATIKFLIVEGHGRETEKGLDFGAGAYSTTKAGVDFGPQLSLQHTELVMWASTSDFPAIQLTPPGTRGPLVPPGLTGADFILTFAKVLSFVPWSNMRRVYPGAGWPQGIDVKFIDDDKETGTTAQFLRLRVGRTTPLFRIPANTHVYVVQGGVDLIPAGSAPVRLERDFYAFIPKNFAISFSNPKQYDGPVAR